MKPMTSESDIFFLRFYGHQVSAEQRLWRRLCRFHFSPLQIEFIQSHMEKERRKMQHLQPPTPTPPPPLQNRAGNNLNLNNSNNNNNNNNNSNNRGGHPYYHRENDNQSWVTLGISFFFLPFCFWMKLERNS